MIVKWLKQSNQATYDISQFVSTITWSGSAGQASRQLDVSVLYSPKDSNIKDLKIALGDRLILTTEEDILLIDSMVYGRERISEQGTVSYSCYDDLNRLLKSNGTYNFKYTTPEMITRTVCKELELETGKIAKTDVPIKKFLVEGENYYTIIMKAYTKAYKSNGRKYMLLMTGKTLNVVEKGTLLKDVTLQDDYNITASSYSESLDSMINKVKIYNEKGRQTGEVQNEEQLKKYGIFQDVYTREECVNAASAAKSMLKGISRTASIEALGNTRCISGYAVNIFDSASGLTGKFWIESDSHTWQNGNYTMSLDLTFKNIMDVQEDN